MNRPPSSRHLTLVPDEQSVSSSTPERRREIASLTERVRRQDATRRAEGSRVGVAMVMVLSALAFAVTMRPDASSPAATADAEVMGISVERGAPEPLGGTIPDEPWADAIVRIETRRCDGDHSVASGVLVDGVVLTDRHVVEGAASVTVERLSGERFGAVSMRQSASIDMATLVVPELDGGLALATGDRVEPGDRFTMVGFPDGGAADVSTVMVTQRARGVRYPDSAEPLQLGSVVVPGQSGSPLIDGGGRLAGLLYSRSYDGGAGLAHDADEIERQWPAMGSVGFERCD